MEKSKTRSMRAVIQRVLGASVTVEGEKISEIQNGLLLLLGIENGDGQEDIQWLSKKIANLRIFNDGNGKMNRSILDINGEAMVISQFTLYASVKKGNRPSYAKAAKPPVAIPLYQQFISQFEKDLDKQVATGMFGADMKVDLLNDGPVTIVVDTKNKEQ